MSTHRSSRVLLGLVGAATVAALVVPGTAFAKGTPGGGGGGGGGGEEITANSLSVPAIYVGAANPSGLSCDGTYRVPTGVPQTGYPVEGYYYVQGVHSWQAGCLEAAPAATVTAAWGDNLAGDAMMKVGSPIRVEMGLNAGAQGLTGFTVVKLQPDELDRLSAYGTKAVVTLDPVTGELMTYESVPALSTETRVWAAGAHLKIYPEGHPEAAIVDGTASAEINATGRVVYGYNLRVPSVGNYVIEYTFPNVTITGVNKGAVTPNALGDMVSLTITVGGGGGGGGHRP
jgi:hypothetical protein